MNNLDLIRSMSKDELESLLDLISASETREYMDWGKWLEADNPELIPEGIHVLADILIKTSKGFVVDRKTVPCVIINDDVKLCGTRYVRIFDMEAKRICTVPKANLEIAYT